MKDRIPVLREPVLRNLLNVLISQCSFRHSRIEFEMDDDTNAAFGRVLPDVKIFLFLFYVLKSDMIVKILASIRQQVMLRNRRVRSL